MALTNEQRQILYARSAGFSGVDISATIHMPPIPFEQQDLGFGPRNDNLGMVYQLGAIQTLTYSVYSSKEAVRSLGFRAPINYARGGRTIAGTMIFNQLYNHPFEDRALRSVINPRVGGILSYSSGHVSYARLNEHNFDLPEGSSEVFRPEVHRRHMYDFTWDQRNMGRRMHPADMPKFDIICTFVNEAGNVGKMVLYGVDLVHEASVLSIEDIYTEVTYQYVAQDIEYFYAENWEGASRWSSDALLGGGQDAVEAQDVVSAQSDAIAQAQAAAGAPVQIATSEARRRANAQALINRAREDRQRREIRNTFGSGR